MPGDNHYQRARTNASTGQRGEDAAAGYLTQQGCSILARNWRAGHGEIDIVASCPPETSDAKLGGATLPSVLVFVEVRTRHGRAGLAEESISQRKALSMVEAAYAYMASHNLDSEATRWRVDLVAISMSATGIKSINWIKGALDEDMVYGGAGT